MKVVVIGAGAVGIGIGSSLSSQGAEVLYAVRRKELARALGERGVSRAGFFGDLHIAPDRFGVTDDLPAIALAAKGKEGIAQVDGNAPYLSPS